jgi:hypothetical protein
LSESAIAQARYALFEKLIHARQSLELAQEVYPEKSANVTFWRHECERVSAALSEFGGRP